MPVSNILMPDDIDFAAYMNLTDAGHKVVSGMAFANDVAELINRPDRVSGLCMP